MAELNQRLIEQRLSSRWVGRPCHFERETTSTNERLQALATQAGAALTAGTMLIADFQSQGKGRLGRQWQAPAGTSLLFSLFFRPDWPAEQAAWLTMMASLAAVAAIEQVTPAPVAVKWPNDLVIGSQAGWRKVGGLLLAGDFRPDGRLQTAVLGIGINVNIPADQLPPAATPASSLLVASGHTVSRLDLLADLLQRLETLYDSGQSPHGRWSARLINLGRPVTVTQITGGQPAAVLAGIAEGVDSWGRLLLRDEQGRRHAVTAGDVTLRDSGSIG